MSLSIIEVKAIPHSQLLETTVSKAKHSICSAFDSLLSYFASTSSADGSVIELVVSKRSSGNPHLYITIRCDDGGGVALSEKLCDSIEQALTQVNFVVERIIGERLAEVVGAIRKCISGRLTAICKSEKLVSSAASYSGYYYYTDVLNVNGERHELSNYTALFNQLMLCKSAVVAFQLIPTQISQQEFYAFSNLATELSSTTRGVRINSQIFQESSADIPKKTYEYYTDRASQPLFVGNIIVASDTEDTNPLVAALITDIQASVAEPVSLCSIEVNSPSSFAYDFFKLPWNLYNELLLNYRNTHIWNGTVYQPSNLMRLPFLYTASEAVSFFRLPIDDGKVKGLTRNMIENDNTPVSEKVLDKNNILFGHILNTNEQIGVRASEFTRHALIVGTPGSGKTTFALNLLLQFYEKGIPFLAIEPTKTEYRAMIDKIPDLQVFTPGNSNVIPFIINPFIPPKGIRLEQYIPSLMSAFRAAFSMESPLDVIFLRAIRQCYSQYGWKNGSTSDDPDVEHFGLFEFILIFKKIVSSSSYKQETKANIETGGTFRLMNLLDQNRYIYDTVKTIPIEALLERPTVLELNAISDDEQKALIMALLLIGVYLYTKERGSSSGEINNVLLIDEAHVLLDTPAKRCNEQDKAQSTTVSSLQKMIAEIRSYGTGIIIADQVPSKVTSDVVADTDIKVSFRLVEQNERGIIANSANLSDQQFQQLARLKKGEAIVYFSDLDGAKAIIAPDVRSENYIRFHVPDREIAEKASFWKGREEMLIPFSECLLCEQCVSYGQCNLNIREQSEYYASRIIATLGLSIRDKESLIKYMIRLHELVIKYEVGSPKRLPLKLLCNCTKIQFLRNILMDANFYLGRQAIEAILSKSLIKEAHDNV